jgi:hypothetical protein
VDKWAQIDPRRGRAWAPNVTKPLAKPGQTFPDPGPMLRQILSRGL